MKVVHCMREVCTHYCGRHSSYSRALGRPVDLSVLGNPFPMADESERAAVCNQHRVHLWKRMQADKRIARMIRDLPEDAVLGCFCAPRECHCDDLIRAHAWLNSEAGKAFLGVEEALRDGKEGL